MFFVVACEIWFPDKSLGKSATAPFVKAALVKLAEAAEVIPTKSKSGPHTREDVTRTHQGEQGEEEDDVEVPPAVKPQSKAGASYKLEPGPSSHHLLLVVRSVDAVPVHFLLMSWKKVPWLVYVWCWLCPWCRWWFAWCWTCS